MATYNALVLESRDKPLQLRTISLPQVVPGSALVKVLAAFVSPHTRYVLRGDFRTSLSTPTIPSACAVGRISALGPDAVSLCEGQLVFTDFCVAARDDPDAKTLQGYMGFVPKLDEHWTNGTFAEYTLVPLERCWSLNEEVLTSRYGYSFAELVYLPNLAIPHAGLQEIEAQPGDTIIVAPATGYFGGLAVHAALACGAKVIAAGRNIEKLSRLESTFKSTGRIATVVLTGDVTTDSKALIAASGSAGADKYIDFSPPQSSTSKHFQSCISALRQSGRCALMGFVHGNVEIPYALLVQKNIRLQGRFMFSDAHARQTVRLVETGLLTLGPKSGIETRSFKLEDIEGALSAAETHSSWGNVIVLEP